MPKIKICGLFREQDIEFANEAKPDFIGFVFAKSHRRINPETAALYKQRLNPQITTVGVFVNAEILSIVKLYNSGIINIAQLHGSESEEYINALKETCNIPVIKAVNIESAMPANADYLLFDNGKGGTGKAFDWNLIPKCNKEFFLAGGINLNNIKEAAKLGPYGIDLSSGVENEKGEKDREKIIEACRIVKDCH
ncbi:phosphoribosylanthranilate isomerase [Fibrobacteria bacterium R8-3-H12]